MRPARLAVSALLLAIARVCLRFCSLDRTRVVLRRAARTLRAHADATAVESVVLGAARRLPWRVTCLHEALVAEALLRNAGVNCELRIGARRDATTHRFHAWLDHNGVVIIGATDLPHTVLLSS